MCQTKYRKWHCELLDICIHFGVLSFPWYFFIHPNHLGDWYFYFCFLSLILVWVKPDKENICMYVLTFKSELRFLFFLVSISQTSHLGASYAFCCLFFFSLLLIDKVSVLLCCLQMYSCDNYITGRDSKSSWSFTYQKGDRKCFSAWYSHWWLWLP